MRLQGLGMDASLRESWNFSLAKDAEAIAFASRFHQYSGSQPPEHSWTHDQTFEAYSATKVWRCFGRRLHSNARKGVLKK